MRKPRFLQVNYGLIVNLHVDFVNLTDEIVNLHDKFFENEHSI